MLDIQKREGSGGSNSEARREMTGGNRNNRKDCRRSSKGPQNGAELDLDATSECLRTDYRIIEGMKVASEKGDFDITTVG
jgi:hypothetical protein